MRENFLRERVESLCGRLSPPKSISGTPQLMEEEMGGIIRVIGALMPRSGFEDWWYKFEDALLANHQSRAWPTQNEIRKAASFREDASSDQVLSQQIIWAGEYFDQYQKACPWFNSVEITNRFLSTGRLRNLSEAMHYGFEMSQNQRENAKSAPMCRPAWEHHVGVMARLRGVTYDEAERVERQQISPSLQPV